MKRTPSCHLHSMLVQSHDKEQIHIESENSIDKIYIYDITGRVVLKEYMDETLTSCNLNIKQLASGIYNLKIYTESGIVYKKMIKE